MLFTVIFKSERILPVAFVSFQRRRKTLLWLDDFPESQESLRVRSEIPGAKWFDELEAIEQKHMPGAFSTGYLRPWSPERVARMARMEQRIRGAIR